MPAATIIQLRRDTAANWSSNNPTLAAGEVGYETDTAQIKIGNGTSSWAALAYGGPTGPAQTLVLESYGDGGDGNVTISSGTTTLVRDMYYNNLTLSGTGQLQPAGFKFFVAGILDISAAPNGAIQFIGNSGAAATVQTGAAAGAAVAGTTIGSNFAGGAGATGPLGAGALAVAGGSATPSNGGASGAGGAGGAGNAGGTNAGGASRAASTSLLPLSIRRYECDLWRGVALITGGAGGPGGSSGGGDGANTGRGGGGGGAGGGIVAIWANTINRGVGTAAGAIKAVGGFGGNGAAGVSGITGGGGGGAGGGGGWIYIQYQTLTGASATNALDASGGDGGNGGNGIGVGATGGSGGQGGNGGRITLLQVSTSIGSELNNTLTVAASASGPSGLTGGANSGGVSTRVTL